MCAFASFIWQRKLIFTCTIFHLLLLLLQFCWRREQFTRSTLHSYTKSIKHSLPNSWETIRCPFISRILRGIFDGCIVHSHILIRPNNKKFTMKLMMMMMEKHKKPLLDLVSTHLIINVHLDLLLQSGFFFHNDALFNFFSSPSYESLISIFQACTFTIFHGSYVSLYFLLYIYGEVQWIMFVSVHRNCCLGLMVFSLSSNRNAKCKRLMSSKEAKRNDKKTTKKDFYFAVSSFFNLQRTQHQWENAFVLMAWEIPFALFAYSNQLCWT